MTCFACTIKYINKMDIWWSFPTKITSKKQGRADCLPHNQANSLVD